MNLSACKMQGHGVQKLTLLHFHQGMAFTNTSPLLVPTRSKTEVLGTNPICVAAPGKDGDSFVLDMAVTSVALGKVINVIFGTGVRLFLRPGSCGRALNRWFHPRDGRKFVCDD